jgi:BolA protein
MEDAMRSKVLCTHPNPTLFTCPNEYQPQITAALSPTTLEIHNDSHLHSHHKAMAGSTSQETHFRVVITSEAFKSKMQPARHRMVYALLKEEMAQEGGIHALQLRTRTPEEEAKQAEREKQENGEPIASAGMETP